MKIVSIEPTPNPNSMKLNLDEALAASEKHAFTRERSESAPGYLRALLRIPGVKSVYQVADFIALERNPKVGWLTILPEARRVFEDPTQQHLTPVEPSAAFGEVGVFVQMFRGIPMQLKLVAGMEQVRVALPERFGLAAKLAAGASTTFLAERKWAPKGVRYGEFPEIGAEMAAQIDAAYGDERLAHLVAQAMEQGAVTEVELEELDSKVVAQRLDDPDWRNRYAALERLSLTDEAFPTLLKALTDSNPGVRRLATVYVGTLDGPEVLPTLCRSLQDPSAVVRRAAGDGLSDKGDPGAMGPMAQALQDPSKLVRWRAARYLYEVGDPSALPALHNAEADPEFEVSLQVRMAIERIEGGKAAVEPAWQQMIRRMNEG